jgi:NADPH-dependent 2,4-dienoyl-CoA reductase/sulfur reductase-like enzyme/rhodanese-related sulfurtransferase
MSKRVLIIGGVAGGAACAARLRRMDERAEIFIFERGPDVSFANCGLPYKIGGAIQDRQRLLVATPERFRDWLAIEVRTRHEVVAIDRKQRTVTLRKTADALPTANCQLPTTGHATWTEHYDALVLSPGATPIRPPIPGIELPGVFTLRNLQDLDAIERWMAEHQPARAAVIGGGYIGLEMIENLARRGIDVTVLEQLDQVMPPMDAEMVTPAHAELRSHGVDLQLSNAAAAIEAGPGDRLTVVAKSGERFIAGIVILAVGVRPDVKLAREAGLEIGPTGGIRVDPQMRTSDPAIWAVGDAVEVRDYVTGQPTLVALAGPAARQGRIAADAICGRDVKFRGTQGTAVVGVFDLTLGMTGASEKTLRRLGIPYRKSYTHSAHHAGYYPGAEMLAIKLLFDPVSGRILGAQAVGKAGVDKRIDVVAMAIQRESTVYDLEEAEVCYAPQYGSAKDPINIAGAVAANILRGDVEPVYWEDWLAAQGSDATQPLVVDVRSPAEAAAGRVPGTLNIPLGELRSRLGELPRDREIWVHCGVGQRSYYASRILKQNGFSVRNLAGGMRSYQALPKKA